MIIIFTIVAFITLIGYVIFLMASKEGWQKQTTSSCPNDFIPTTGITILIPARNEAEYIEKCLTSILNNQYPEHLLEIIVIDDHSTDNTAELAIKILKNRGKVIFLKDYLNNETINSYKKKALEIGVESATHQWIITTDADCFAPEQWLQSMAFLKESENTQLIVAPVNIFRKNENLVLYYFQSLDFLTLQGLTVSMLQLNLGSMCNGANMGFSKKAFQQVEGYKNIDHIASGDDLLLMEKIQKEFPEEVRYLKSTSAIMQTEAQKTWKDLFNQRIRWASKNDKYQNKKMIGILFLIFFFNFLLTLGCILAIWNKDYWKIITMLFIIKVGTEIIFLFPVAKFYNKTKELWFFLFLQPLHILYVVFIGLLGKFGTYSWKGRVVK